MSELKRRVDIIRNYVSILGGYQTASLYGARLFKRPMLVFKVNGIKHPVKCRTMNSDRMTLAQVFGDGDCDIPLNEPPQFIIDGGANVGYASVLLANLYPDATILAVEPDSTNLRIARENCQPYPNVYFVQGGIWSSDASLSIQNPDDESWAFRVAETSPGEPAALQGFSIPTLLKNAGFDKIDLLKLDVEGAEGAIFSCTDLSWLDCVQNLVIETHGEENQRIVLEAMKDRQFVQSSKGEKLLFSRR